MNRFTLAAVCAIAALPALGGEKPMRIWNLTSSPIVDLRLAPQGSQAFSADLTKRDKDGEIEHDERLVLGDMTPGDYDARVKLKDGRACSLAGLRLTAGKVTAIEESNLENCAK
ncbi:MAG: hypothetical protein KGL46_00735 [Hyphomicrobiales bacterium]|nr:hypothetical protein [Hyphomicrobiales bacterium]